MSTEWFSAIESEFTTKILSKKEQAPGELEIKVKNPDHLALLRKMQSDEGGAFVHLSDLTGYDEHPKSPRFHVVYNLISMKLKTRAAVVVVVESNEKPQVESVTSLWAGANWLERETYDMLGIEFLGHPDQRRILLPPSFVGYPLRKDFLVDYRQQFAAPVDEEQTFDPFGNTIVKTESTNGV